MHSSIYKILTVSAAILITTSPFFVSAQPTTNPSNPSNPTTNPSNPSNPTTNPSNSPSANQLNNPLEFDSISGFLLAILDILLIFALPIIIFFIIYAGFLFVTARGDTTKIATARSALTWAVIGGVIVLGATLLVDVIQGTVDELR